jgi:hypothetical protein
VNSVTIVQLVELLTVVQTGLQVNLENLSQVSVPAPGVTQVVLVMTVHLEENGLKKNQPALLVVNGLKTSLLAHLVVSGLLKSQLALPSVSGLKRSLLVHQEESGLLKSQPVLLVVNGLKKDQLVVSLVHVMTVVREILADQIVLLVMRTVSVLLMAQGRRLQTRRLSLKMLF